MIDPFARKITYLRVSVTDRCDLRCIYCMAENMTFLPKADILSIEELERLCRAFVRLGVRKLRLTGGEPLVRRNVMQLIGNLGTLVKRGELDELTLTTNGTRLAKYAGELVEAGVRRVNVSLDTLDPEKFRLITRRGDFDKVMDGLAAARAAGLKIKINTVALKGVSDMDFDRLVAWCGEHGFDLTFIETMPMGDVASERTDNYLPLTELRGRLAANWTLTDSEYRTGGPSRYVGVAETGGRIGFIQPMSHSFCDSCNRVRITCTGTLYMCLGQEDAADLRTPLRASEGDELLTEAIRDAISRKPKGHDFVVDLSKNKPAVARHMSTTGG